MKPEGGPRCSCYSSAGAVGGILPSTRMRPTGGHCHPSPGALQVTHEEEEMVEEDAALSPASRKDRQPAWAAPCLGPGDITP